MSQYLVLIYQDESTITASSGEKMSAGHRTFMEQRSGVLRGGAALESEATATSIRPDGAGGFLVTDGPFAESKEALGGYYLIEAADLDEALAIAKEIPAPHGGVEVRPVRVMS